MPRCRECEWFHRAPFTQRRLCRATFQHVHSEQSADACLHFEQKPIDTQPGEEQQESSPK